MSQRSWAALPDGRTAEHAFAEHEHHDLASGIDRLHLVAGMVGTTAAPALSIALRDILRWIDTVLAPHDAWEDGWLYPEIDARAGTCWATKVMTFEHHQIGAIAQRLRLDHDVLARELNHAQATELRGHLFGLEALLRAHIEREERFLMPVLDSEAGEGIPAMASGSGRTA